MQDRQAAGRQHHQRDGLGSLFTASSNQKFFVSLRKMYELLTSFSKQLLRAFRIAGTVDDTRDLKMNQTQPLTLRRFRIWWSARQSTIIAKVVKVNRIMLSSKCHSTCPFLLEAPRKVLFKEMHISTYRC